MVLPHGGLEDAPPFNLTAIDRAVLASTDEEFHLQTWEDLKIIIGTAAAATNCPVTCSIWINIMAQQTMTFTFSNANPPTYAATSNGPGTSKPPTALSPTTSCGSG
jgi:hypothetical protein